MHVQLYTYVKWTQETGSDEWIVLDRDSSDRSAVVLFLTISAIEDPFVGLRQDFQKTLATRVDADEDFKDSIDT